MKIPLHTQIQQQKERITQARSKEEKETQERILECMRKALYSEMRKERIINHETNYGDW